jgi:hypothetical protein
LSVEQLRRAAKTCPASSDLGTGVFCRIERSLLRYSEHPVSVARFCCGDYQQCSTWRAERENEIAQRRMLKTVPLVSEADERAATV